MGPEALGLKTTREFTLWKRGVEILGGGDRAERILETLTWGYERELHGDDSAGSFAAGKAQLEALAQAADAMAVALRALGGAARDALFPGGDEHRMNLWRRAGGEHLLPELQEIASKLGQPVEFIWRSAENGGLAWRFQDSEFSALATFCRSEARVLGELNRGANGLHSAWRLLHGTPKMALAQNTARNLMGAVGDLKDLNELVRVVAELVTKKPQSSRFAEPECTTARRDTQTPTNTMGGSV